MKMNKTRFLRDDSARVPFVVIGIFLVILSTIISLNLTRMDIKMAKTMSSNIEISAPDQALAYAKADLKRALNYAAMEALKKLGETPVINPDNTSQYYNGTNGDTYKFNMNWARAMTNQTFDEYMVSNYMYDTFTYGKYSVNVEPPDSWEKITITPIRTKLNRTIRPPLFEPGKNGNGYETYWKVSIPVKIHLNDLDMKSELLSENTIVETLITSRYPLLHDLTEEYEQRVNGTNAVMTETTAFAMAYTWGRGYMQYGKHTPLNIVNNTHLSLILNGALLLDQGFVFNSIDPMSLVEYANQTAYTISGKKKKYEDVMLDNNSIKVDPKEDAYNSTDDPDKAKEESQKGKYDFNTTVITDYLNNDSKPEGSIVNKKISAVIIPVYSTLFATGVARQTTDYPGSHDGYEESDSIEEWGEPDSMTQTGTIAKDSYIPGNLYGETWELTWTRNHVWRHTYWITVSCGAGCTKQVPQYNYMTTTDSRMDRVAITLKAVENSNTNINLDFAGKSLASKNDLLGTYVSKNVTYGLNLLNGVDYIDPNLEPAYLQYRNIFDSNKISNLKNMGLNGDTDGKSFTVDEPSWVSGESHYAVDDITERMRNDIHLDPDINYENYPVPSDLINAARDDLIGKISVREAGYVNRPDYYSGKYNSAGAKVISVIREWYVDQVKYQIREKFSEGSKRIDDEIKINFSEPDKVKQANRDATKFLSRGFKLPLAVSMRAYHVDENGNIYEPGKLQAWNESVTLLINQEPNFLDAEMPYGEEQLYTLKLRNINLLGGNGVHILPSLEPWIATFNAWSIDVEGEFVKFEVQDVDNEVHPDPIFGHEAQVYVRQDVLDVYDPVTGLSIGSNLPIKFNFTTGTFIVVPPGKVDGVGDKDWVIIEESTGFKVKK
ncbi:hypothetical protein [Candidatus Methanoperedens sp. BLZ2]|nr:hypothetical protein [Candidatus Methanoperedens sp. BLZ2]KAB2945528.1 MAG: hypothetical protein F9K14_10895 [Candidatus Methanoperedens sp.]